MIHVTRRIRQILTNGYRRLIGRAVNVVRQGPDRILDMLTVSANGTVRLGTTYGGWHVYAPAIKAGDVVISAGAGEDVSFDMDVAERFNCRVLVVDPTPRAIRHFEATVEALRAGRQAPINNSDTEFYRTPPDRLCLLSFHPLGLWTSRQVMRFYEPRNKEHVSHSIGNIQDTDEFFEAQCVPIADLLSSNGISEPAAVKMDIEGAEYAVIRDMLRSGVRPGQLMIEFHLGKTLLEQKLKLRLICHVLLLRMTGYKLVRRDGWDYLFVRSQLLAGH